ncbi:allantoate amidohydrolase [Citricoccus muralis]|uniref:N-carbamoyl-L-amino-acid hydrolase n=1 Tax=Citricoccus muralis TaxID=169134 RepID=A0A3D9LGE6_9MICC|nr:allantoate amidohydrolase [Citricoccus muralis]REE04173.1 N-carbamoyl-L-amino-acid hydrolase [Citricoccus muralis]
MKTPTTAEGRTASDASTGYSNSASADLGAARTVLSLMRSIEDIGRDRARGGYSRPVYGSAELELRSWFLEAAAQRDLDVETDRNGIMWAWWYAPGKQRRDAVVTGSHLDSVPGGGAYDGPLGVASSLAAIDVLRDRGFVPSRPIVVAVFPEEEGSRFGVACLGSRLLTGAISPERALALRDGEGVTFAQALTTQGGRGDRIGADRDMLARIGIFLELHVEQGRGLIDLGAPVGVASSILGHGRWRLSAHGQGNHAGTTLMAGRQDAMVAAARTVVAVREIALEHSGARATVGRLQPIPGGTNVIASRVDFWLDVRHAEDAVTAVIVEKIHAEARRLAAEEGCTMDLVEESVSGTVHFDATLGLELSVATGGSPMLPTGAGHDAGVLASEVPTAMLFVRNPTGISHSPEELCEDDDARLGTVALADALAHHAG